MACVFERSELADGIFVDVLESVSLRPRYCQQHISKTSGAVNLRRDTICHSAGRPPGPWQRSNRQRVEGCENSVLSRCSLILNPSEFRSNSVSDAVDNTRLVQPCSPIVVVALGGLRHQSRYVPTTSRVWVSLIRHSKLGGTIENGWYGWISKIGRNEAEACHLRSCTIYWGSQIPTCILCP